MLISQTGFSNQSLSYRNQSIDRDLRHEVFNNLQNLIPKY